jgi:predicted dinucleotide-binding enzyme
MFGDIVVLAVKGTAAEAVVRQISTSLKGKTVLDTTNPIAEAPPENGVLKFFTSLNESLMERLQAIAPEANFVKAFNCVGNTLMIDPKLPGGKPTMFICGNSDEAKKETTKLLDLIGWEVNDMGKVQSARAIEPLCMLWCIPGFLQNDWSHAFKMLRA